VTLQLAQNKLTVKIVITVPVPLLDLTLGLLLCVRRSDKRMALLCAVTLVTFGGEIQLYDLSGGSVEPSLATTTLVRIVALVLFGVGQSSLVLYFYLFPSGRFVPAGHAGLLC
jgi:hypothetical protein